MGGINLKNVHNHVSIVIPMYNEELVVKNVLLELVEMYPDYLIIVVDDNSTDASFTQACVKGVYILRHIINLGQGAALQTGIEFARKMGTEYVVTFDADGQHDSKDIAPFVAELEKNEVDIVLGSRFLGHIKNMPKKKKFLLKISRYFTWVVTGILLTDSHNGFRAINIGKFPNFEIIHNRMAHASEIINIIKTLKMKYIEKPCTVKYTEYTIQKGQSMWNSINIIFDYLLGNLIK